MPTSVWSIKSVLAEIKSHQSHRSLLQWKKLSNNGAWTSLGKFSHTRQEAPLYFKCYQLLDAMDKGSSAKIGEQSGSHQISATEHHFQVQHSYITCLLQCNILFIIKNLLFFIGKWYYIEAFQKLLSIGEWSC